jgi:hypothetical protein
MRDYQTEGKPIEVEGAPTEADISTADVADRVDDGPEAADNRSQVPEDAICLADREVPEDR